MPTITRTLVMSLAACSWILIVIVAVNWLARRDDEWFGRMVEKLGDDGDGDSDRDEGDIS